MKEHSTESPLIAVSTPKRSPVMDVVQVCCHGYLDIFFTVHTKENNVHTLCFALFIIEVAITLLLLVLLLLVVVVVQ